MRATTQGYSKAPEKFGEMRTFHTFLLGVDCVHCGTDTRVLPSSPESAGCLQHSTFWLLISFNKGSSHSVHTGRAGCSDLCCLILLTLVILVLVSQDC